MAFYLWMFPLLFIFHDMEEIIGLVPWIHLNETLLGSKGSSYSQDSQRNYNRGVALAVLRSLSLSYPSLY